MCLWWSTGRDRMSQAPAVQLELEHCGGLDAKIQQSTAHANSAQTSCSLHVAPRFLPRNYGQEYRYPVLNKKKKSSFRPSTQQNWETFLHWNLIIVAFLSIHRKANSVLHSWVTCPSLSWGFCSSQFPEKHQGGTFHQPYKASSWQWLTFFP